MDKENNNIVSDNNTGRWNTGDSNTGNWNTGDSNTGDWNAGNKNAGDWNAGNKNAGDHNTGDGNTGNWNTGSYNTNDCNVGNKNTGDCNTGSSNTGNGNTGHKNTGNYNTGICNTGDCNTGDYNVGDWNTGDWNTSNFNIGCFMTASNQKIPMFNKPSEWTYRDWSCSRARSLLRQIPQSPVIWTPAEEMTPEEKTQYPTYKTTGGYLKVLKADRSGRAQRWWDSLVMEDKEEILSLPNFDAKIFKKCTGIDVTGNAGDKEA